MSNNLTMIKAITQALDQEMEKDNQVLLFGEGIGKNGGVFRATEGLQEKYGKDRVSDTPLAESAIGGLGIGLAVQGFRPVLEIQYFSFVYEVMDSIAGQMARQRYRTGGQIDMPIVVRAATGGGVYAAEMHADSLEGLMAQSPGLKVVMPSTAYDAKGLLTAAMRDDDPVIFLEHMKLYRSFYEDVPFEQYEIELGKANVSRPGRDITIIAYGAMARTALQAAEELQAEGIDAEVIDLRTIAPIDLETLITSVEKTGHVVVVQEAQRQAGIGHQIISELSQRAILFLEAPPYLVASPDTIYPFGLIEDEWLPASHDIVDAAIKTLEF